jgi:hypothetical protein
MMKGVDAEEEIDGMVLAGERVSGAYLELDLIPYPLIDRIFLGKLNHDRGQINSFESNLWKGF